MRTSKLKAVTLVTGVTTFFVKDAIRGCIRYKWFSLVTGMVLGAIMATSSALATSSGWWQPVPGMSWQIQYTGSLATSVNAEVFNIDLFDNPATVIAGLHALGKKVICYFSGGTYENWRPDTSSFPAAVLGRKNGWPGERWLDVRQLSVLLSIMTARMRLAVQKGCDAVDPDNMDGYSNRTGFPLTAQDQLKYNMAIFSVAHSLGLAVSLKNDLDQVQELLPYVDFAVNEECFDHNECNLLLPFVNTGKPVFGIEYALSTNSFCSKANQMNFDFLKKKLSLDAVRVSCR
jgi:hypothetical protein